MSKLQHNIEALESLQRDIIERREADGTYEGFRQLRAAGLAPMMGGDNPSPVHPLAAPTVSGTQITVDLMLNQPARITRMIMDLTQQRFIADRVFSSGGGVTGGAVVYDVAQENELYLDRDVQKIDPGGEFPVVTSERLQPQVAEVEKWGGKVWIPDEARDRNQTALFTNKIRQLANTIVRKINQRAVETLRNAISTYSRTAVGNDWTAVVTGGSSQSNASLWPMADFVHANEQAMEDELGVTYDLVLLNPADYAQLVIVYGADQIDALLRAVGYTMYVSNRVPAGSPIIVASGQVGEMRIEKPLGSVTWREEGRERTWTQSSVRPVFFVDNPFAVRQVTGVGG